MYDNMFNIVKNIKSKTTNNLISSKLVAYNDKMHTNNMIKSKSSEYHASESATLTLKSLIEFVIDLCRSFNTKQTQVKSNSVAQNNGQHHTQTRKP